MLKKIGFICGVFILLVTAVALFSGPAKKRDDTSKQATAQNQQTAEPTKQKAISAIQKNDLEGFSKPTIIKASKGYVIATYLSSSKSMSVSIFDNGSIDSHTDGLYNIDRGTITVDGIEMIAGYSTPSEYANPYQSLAFDFKLGDFTYSGEVSHIGLGAKESGDKQKLLDTLTNFVESLKKEV